jgi:hypothetical protein
MASLGKVGGNVPQRVALPRLWVGSAQTLRHGECIQQALVALIGSRNCHLGETLAALDLPSRGAATGSGGGKLLHQARLFELGKHTGNLAHRNAHFVVAVCQIVAARLSRG